MSKKPKFTSAHTRNSVRSYITTAFRAISSLSRGPAEIEMLTNDKGFTPSPKSTTYRLIGCGPNAGNVIAKHAKKDLLQREAEIYCKVLASLDIESVKFIGFYTPTNDSTDGVLFLEEARGEQYDEKNPGHRLAASSWLGKFHALTQSHESFALKMREIGCANYLENLKIVKKAWRSALSLPNFDRPNFISTDSTLDALEEDWHIVEVFCQSMPLCIAHLDVISKNARVSRNGSEYNFQLYDWDEAKFGIPVEDVAGLDSQVWRSQLNKYGLCIDQNTAVRIEALGRLFRTIGWIKAEFNLTALEELTWHKPYLSYCGEEVNNAWADFNSC